MPVSEEKSTVGILLDPGRLDDILRRLDAIERPTGGTTGDAGGNGRSHTTTGATPHVVVTSTSVGTNQWEYVIAPVVGGGTTYAGELKIPGVSYKARNRWEELAKAGYVTTLTGLRAIPNGAPIMAYLSVRNKLPIYLFAERNEGVC